MDATAKQPCSSCQQEARQKAVGEVELHGGDDSVSRRLPTNDVCILGRSSPGSQHLRPDTPAEAENERLLFI